MNTFAISGVFKEEPETRGDVPMVQRTVLFMIAVMGLAVVCCAQENQEETITDLDQFWNRTSWRIQNINRLVNLGDPDKEYERLIYELEKFRSYIEQAEKNFVPENASKKDTFSSLTGSIKSIGDEMINLAYSKNKDGLVTKTGELFRKYTELKQVLKADPMAQFE